MTTETHLSEQQLARIEAMAAVAHYVQDTKFMNTSRAEPADLVWLSEYVLKGFVEEEKD